MLADERSFEFITERFEFDSNAVLAVRRSRWPESTSSASNDETGRVAWRALPSLCAFLTSSRGREIICARASVLELGAGLGVPGLLCARLGARRVTLTDGNADVVEDLRQAIDANERMERFEECMIDASVLVFGTDDGEDVGSWAAVVASDVVYSSASASGILYTVDRALDIGGVFILSYVSRWPHVDRALMEAIEDAKFVAKWVPERNFTRASEDAAEERPSVFVMTRAVNDAGERVKGWMYAEESTTGREWFDGSRKTFKVTGVDALTSTFAQDVDAVFAAHGEDVECMEVNGKGPYRMSVSIISALFESLAKYGVRLLSLKLNECWLDAHSWHILGHYLANATHAIETLEIRGESIDSDGLRAMVCDGNAWVRGLRRLALSRCEKLDAEGARILRTKWFQNLSISALESFDIEFCSLGDEGFKEICAMDWSSLRELRLSSVDVSAFGVCALTNALASIKRLRILDLSGNDQIESSGAAELGDRLVDVSQTLEVLDLRGCNVGDQGLFWLSSNVTALPSLGKLEILKMGSNGIGDAPMEQFSKYLRLQNSLKALDLSMNLISWNGAYDLSEAFEDADNNSLLSLNLRGNHIGSDGVQAIAEVIGRLKALQALDLSDVDVGVKGVAALLDALKTPLHVALASNPDLDEDDALKDEVRSKELFANVKLPEKSNHSVGIGR